jgi:hypothetical protein
MKPYSNIIAIWHKHKDLPSLAKNPGDLLACFQQVINLANLNTPYSA